MKALMVSISWYFQGFATKRFDKQTDTMHDYIERTSGFDLQRTS